MINTLVVGEMKDGKLSENSFDLLKISDEIPDHTSLVLCTSSQYNVSLDEIKILPVDFIYLLKTFIHSFIHSFMVYKSSYLTTRKRPLFKQLF